MKPNQTKSVHYSSPNFNHSFQAATATTSKTGELPLNICPHHYQEWLDSGVDPEIIALNVQSLAGNNVYEALCYGLPHKERRNDGRLRDKWLKRVSGMVENKNWQWVL